MIISRRRVMLGFGIAAQTTGTVFGSGLVLSAVALTAAYADGILLGILLVVAGAAGSSVYAASGRVVVGWFPPGERGLAMSLRQTSQPLGVAIAGAALPVLAHA